jgi:hypothetical protein
MTIGPSVPFPYPIAVANNNTMIIPIIPNPMEIAVGESGGNIILPEGY